MPLAAAHAQVEPYEAEPGVGLVVGGGGPLVDH